MPVIVRNGVGLGDLLSAGFSKLGIEPCGGCARRAAALNRLYTFADPVPRTVGEGKSWRKSS